MENANVTIQNNSTVEANNFALIHSQGWWWDFSEAPYNASLTVLDSAIAGAIVDMGLNTSVSITNSHVDTITTQLWVNGSATISNNTLTSGAEYSTKAFTLANASYTHSQFFVLGTANATIAIEASHIYSLYAGWDANVTISNSNITDVVSAVDHATVVIEDSTLFGEGLAVLGALSVEYGTVGNLQAGLFSENFTKCDGWRPLFSPLFDFHNCTIAGYLSPVQNTTLVLGAILYHRLGSSAAPAFRARVWPAK